MNGLCPTCFDRLPEGAGTCTTCASVAARNVSPAAAHRSDAGFEPAPLPGLDEAPVAIPLLCALAGAMIGALLWALVARATGYEIGYLAWAIGALAGGSCVLARGRGPLLAAAAGVLALGGIATGKVYGTHLLVHGQLAHLEEMFDRAAYEELRALAMEPPAVPGDESGLPPELARLAAAEEMTEAEMQEMLAEQDRAFAALRAPDYTFERWRDDQVQMLHGSVPLLDIVRESLSPIDLLFALLGIASAWGIVARAGQREFA